MARTGYQADQGGRWFLTHSLKVELTKYERQWLGATVRRSDGSVGQVWALAPERGYVWVVADGDHWFAIHVDALEKVSEGLTPLPLEV